MTTKEQSKQLFNSDEGGNGSIPLADLYQCGKCQKKLGRHRFPKTIFRRLVATNDGKGNNRSSSSSTVPNATKQNNLENLVCHHCRRLETAHRCKQIPPKIVLESSRAESGTKRRPNNFGYCDYVDKLLGMDCFSSHIAPLKVFTSAKDISESMAAVQAVFRHGQISEVTPHQSSSILCLCIGDGCTPRTAMLMSFLAKKSEYWQCVSIDPMLAEEWIVRDDDGVSTRGVTGLHCYKGTLKEFLEDPNRPPRQTQSNLQHYRRWRHLVLICVHSHHRFVLESSIENIRSQFSFAKKTLLPTTIISLPCCPTFRHVRDIGTSPNLKYDDDCVFSACRSVEVWNLIEESKDDLYCIETRSFTSDGMALKK